MTPAAAHATFPGQNGKLAYTDSTGHSEIATINPDGSGFALLTNNPGFFNIEPAWSADGRKIAFASSRDSHLELWIMNADGSSPTKLPTPPLTGSRQPAWSPDGRKLAFSGNEDIYVVNVDGTGLTQMTGEAGSERDPEWSPDGTKIAYDSNQTGRFDVYVMDANGAGKTNLTQTPDIHDQAPSWSPDGSRIAYFAGNFASNVPVQVFSMRPDGSDVTQLSDGSISYWPAWSPDGQKIAFASNRDGGGDELYVMNADGTSETRVTFSGGTRTDFNWQPIVNQPPQCTGVKASRPVLTTANRKLVPITLDGSTDPDGDPITLMVDGVTQDEPVTGRSDNTSPDAIDEGEGELRVRAERNPHGDGRVYRIAFTASDDHGSSCSGTVTVSVSRKKHKPAVDSAPPSYDSFAGR
jgi:Tol biopolymer transport system component